MKSHSLNFAGFRYSLIPRLSHTSARYKFFGYTLFHQSNISNQIPLLAALHAGDKNKNTSWREIKQCWTGRQSIKFPFKDIFTF